MTITSEQLIRLGERLRTAGFTIGPGQYLDAQRLVNRLADRGDLPDDLDGLSAYLAPIYCTSPEQQQQFPAYLTEALGLPWKKGGEGTVPVITVKRRFRLWLFLVVSTVILGCLVYWGLLYVPRTLTGIVAREGKPVSGAKVVLSGKKESLLHERLSDPAGRFSAPVRVADFPVTIKLHKPVTARLSYTASITLYRFPQQPLQIVPEQKESPAAPEPPPARHLERVYTSAVRPDALPSYHVEKETVYQWRHIAIIVSPLIAALLWWCYWTHRRRAWLLRIPGETPKTIKDLSSEARRTFTMAFDTQRAGSEWRRRRWVESPELNVEATLRGTLQRGGAPTPVFGSRVEPEYLILIDATAMGDHMARLADELMVSLQERDVVLDRFFFAANPLFCAGPAEERKPRARRLPVVSLETLYGRYHDRRLIIVSDGKPFFDVITGAPESWLKLLLEWTQPVLMTPTPQENWARREWALSGLGFTLLPLSNEGLYLLSELYGNDKPVTPPRADAASRPTPSWLRETLRMLQSIPPHGFTPGSFRDELRNYLGPDAYLWLQACAVYPEVHWGMTLRIGATLLSDNSRLSASLPRLVRLPWLRESYLPDWVRSVLLTEIPEQDEAWVQAVITGILSQAQEGTDQEIPLRIAPDRTLRFDWRRYWRELVARQTSDHRIHRDVVFLRFMQGRPLLAVRAAEAVRKFFFREGLWTMGARALPILSVSLICSALLLRYFPYETNQEEILKIHVGKPPAITALDMTGDADAPVVLGYANGEIWKVAKAMAQHPERLPDAHSQGLPVATFAWADDKVIAARFGDAQTAVLAVTGRGLWERKVFPQTGVMIFGKSVQEQATISPDGATISAEPGHRNYSRKTQQKILAAVYNDNRLVVATPAKLELYDLSNSQGRMEELDLPFPTAGCTVRPGDRYVMGWHANGDQAEIWRYDLDSRLFAAPLKLQPGENIRLVRTSQDGRLVAVLRGNALEILDGATGVVHAKVPSPVKLAMALSRDGTALATDSVDSGIEVWRLTKVPQLPYLEPEMVLVPAGTFRMGDIWGDGFSNERPVHTVTFSKPFAIGKYEVTFDEYDRFARATGRRLPDDSGFGRGRLPVINVSWDDAVAYCQWLSRLTGVTYRLLTEAEWEYAARSGGKEERWAGTSSEAELGEYAWYEKNSGERAHPVGQKKPNGLGLHDMSGNVWEWCQDWYGEYPTDAVTAPAGPGSRSYRVIRGGGWYYSARYCRSASRDGLTPDLRFDNLGFRLARGQQAQEQGAVPGRDGQPGRGPTGGQFRKGSAQLPGKKK
jgi:formylglycine-generating enzyme required for sulfatase activity